MRLRNYDALPPGMYGGGLLGPPEAHWPTVQREDCEEPPERPEYCRHTGQDYWPRPCDECLRRSEAGQTRKVQP